MTPKNDLLLSLLNTIDDIELWAPGEPKYYGPTTRSLSLYSEVNSESAFLLISQLKHLAEISPETEITLYINTEGGSLTDAFAIYDCIKNIPCPVIIVATGLCASAGLLILSAGDYKLATSNTTFYYHQPVFTQSSSITSKKEMECLNGFYEYCQESVDKILKESMGISERRWKKYFDASTGYYFDASQALKFNLIDKIVESNKLEFEFTEVEESDG